MVSHCANPECGKPLHYLREGRIFIFRSAVHDGATGEKRSHHLEHYWLCGNCSRVSTLTQDASGNVQVVPRLSDIGEPEDRERSTAGAGL